MDKKKLLELLADGPVIAAVKDDAGLAAALASEVPVVFLLYGDLLNIGDLVRQVHDAGKAAFVHLDLVEGDPGRSAPTLWPGTRWPTACCPPKPP